MAGRGAAAGVRARRPSERATDREVVVVAAVLEAGSEKAAQRLGLSHSTVKHHLANARSKVGPRRSTAQLVWIPTAAIETPPIRQTRRVVGSVTRWTIGCWKSRYMAYVDPMTIAPTDSPG